MDFFSLFELAQIRAINSAIDPSMESIYRIRCREYSQKFHTPLDRVMNELDPLMVMEALYEEKYPPSCIEEELEELLDILHKAKDPTYSRMSAEETEALVDAVLNKELARAAKKKRPTQETIQSDIKAAELKPTPAPSKGRPLKSGSMNFGDLEKIDAESERNKGGFNPQ